MVSPVVDIEDDNIEDECEEAGCHDTPMDEGTYAGLCSYHAREAFYDDEGDRRYHERVESE